MDCMGRLTGYSLDSPVKKSCHGGRSQLGSAHLRDAHPRAADAHGHAAGGSPAITKRNWDSGDGSMLGILPAKNM